MVFHGDYEIEYEIYQKEPNDWRLKLLGHTVGVNPQDAIKRWSEQHHLTPAEKEEIEAVVPGCNV
jgi:hypothetical protein